LALEVYRGVLARLAFVASRASLIVGQVSRRSRSAVTGAARKIPGPVRIS
jgi:hypothetical protein